MKKRLFMFLLAIFFLLSAVPATFAVDNLEPDRDCSLILQMQFGGMPLHTGSLTIYRVGEVYAYHGWHFRLVPELSDSGIELDENHLDDRKLAADLADLALKNNLTGVTANIRMGRASFEDLTPGLYVVFQSQSQASQGFDAIAPFLISLPQVDGEHYTYDVVSRPKVPVKPEPTKPTDPSKPTEPRLPQTGQLNWPVPVMASAGMALFALGWYLFFGKREGYET